MVFCAHGCPDRRHLLPKRVEVGASLGRQPADRVAAFAVGPAGQARRLAGRLAGRLPAGTGGQAADKNRARPQSAGPAGRLGRPAAAGAPRSASASPGRLRGLPALGASARAGSKGGLGERASRGSGQRLTVSRPLAQRSARASARQPRARKKDGVRSLAPPVGGSCPAQAAQRRPFLDAQRRHKSPAYSLPPCLLTTT